MTNIDFDKIAQAIGSFLDRHPRARGLMLGEDHNDAFTHFKMLSHPAIINLFQKRDYQSLAIELPTAYQGLVDKTYHGDLTPTQFAQQAVQLAWGHAVRLGQAEISRFEAQGHMIQAQEKYGMLCFYFDNPHLNLHQHMNQVRAVAQEDATALRTAERASAPLQDYLYRRLVERGALNEEIFLRAQVQALFTAYRTNPLARAADENARAIRHSEEAQRARAEQIQKNAAGKFVTLSGFNHGSKFDDMDENLGAVRLSLVRDAEAYVIRSQRDFALGNEKPDGYLILSEARFVTGEDAYAQAQAFMTLYRQIESGGPALTTSQPTAPSRATNPAPPR